MVRKQLADITAGDRAEQRITERVDERITIGMRDDAIFAGNEHTAELHAVARFESMRVVAMADSQPRSSACRRVHAGLIVVVPVAATRTVRVADPPRSEEHTSELQSLMRISYAVFCLKKKKYKIQTTT